MTVSGSPVVDDRELAEHVHRFRASLTATGFTTLLAAYGRSGLRARDLAGARPALQADLGWLVDLLCLARTVPADVVDALLPAPLLDHLVAVGIAERTDDTVRLPAARLVEHFGCLIFVGLRRELRNGYFGPDTVGLGRQLLGARGRCLDLFAATGAQSVLMATTGRAVTAVEVDAALRPVQRLNALLNPGGAPITATWGDATSVELDGAFDTVAANAPLLPNFGVAPLPFGSDGGPDGARLLEAAVDRVRLAPGGRLVATTAAPGDADGPRLDWLRRLAERRGWAVLVLPTGSAGLDADSVLGAEIPVMLAEASGRPADELAGELVTTLAGSGVDRLVFCLVTAVPADHPVVTVAAPAPAGSGWWL